MRFYQAELFARAEERVKRSLHTGQLGSDFYAALSGNCKDQSQQHIVFRYAVFSQAYASEKKVIAAADVKRMLAVQDLQPAILQAQELMQKMRPLVREAGLQGQDLDALDKFEDTLVLIAMQKIKGTEMPDACRKLVDEVQDLTGERICAEYDQRSESPSGSCKPSQGSQLSEHLAVIAVVGWFVLQASSFFQGYAILKLRKIHSTKAKGL